MLIDTTNNYQSDKLLLKDLNFINQLHLYTFHNYLTPCYEVRFKA